jgi:hypothetical protein
MWQILSLGALILVVVNVIASIEIAQDQVLVGTQRIMQTASVWLFPFIGAAVITAVRRSQRVATLPSSRPEAIGSNDYSQALDMVSEQSVDANNVEDHS